ncbi:hypothetical protein [Deinococcus multiflagellatus]|uniref:Lipoprotein n=1 Tax=Deinococcus multiflagellatus TaxID=1656887 RepID=A0ABW1ZMF9_9DEIO
MTRPLLALLGLPLLLCACQDQGARAQTAALQAQVDRLQEEVRALQAAQAEQARALPTNLRQVTEQAAAQNCANSLTRELESFRENSLDQRYPTAAQLVLPPPAPISA